MSDITIEDATEIIEATELPELSAQPAINRDLVEEPSIQVRHDSQANEIEISVDGAEWEIDSVFVEVCDGLVDSDDVSSAIEEVLDSLRDADGPRVPVEDLTAIVTDEGPSASAPAGSARLTDLAQSMADEAIAAQSVEFYINGDSVDVVVERSHGCGQCGQSHYLSGPIHTGSMESWSQQQGCGAILEPSSRTVELDIEGGAVSAEDVDEAIGALTEAVDEVLAEDLEWIERAAPRWAAGHDDADWEDRVAYSGIETSLDEAIVDGAREAGHQAVIEALVHYGACDSVDEARDRVLSALTDAVTSAA